MPMGIREWGLIFTTQNYMKTTTLRTVAMRNYFLRFARVLRPGLMEKKYTLAAPTIII